MKVYLGSGGISPRIFDLGTMWRWLVSFTTRPLFLWGKSLWYPLDRRLGGPQSRSGRGDEEKNSQPVSQRYTNELSPEKTVAQVLRQRPAGLTNSVVQSPSWEANSRSASQEVSRLLWNTKFITVSTKAHYWSLFWARWIRSALSHSISLRSILYHPPIYI
jgi:hypothetical protein